jgi:aryl-alcohol dehydrogenase-like predicted oxidoreductase
MTDNIAFAFRPRRELGRTGFAATRLGIGDIADRSVPLDQCVATLRKAMDAGLNLIDTAPVYEDGYSEQIVGAALQGRRDGIFLIDKVDHLDQPVAPQVGQSLARLDLPGADAFVFHAVPDLAVWQSLAAAGGGFAQLEQCRHRGQCRFRGISSHNPDVLRMAIESGLCDIVLFAIGAYGDQRYLDEILPLARAKGVGTVCFKTFGAGKLLGDTAGYGRPLPEPPAGSGGRGAPTLPRLSVQECLHYTLTCDPDVALLGMSFPNEQDAAFAAAKNFQPLTPQQMVELRAKAAWAIAGKGPCWWNPQ